MPTYDFLCEPCNLRIEYFSSIADLERYGPPLCDRHGPFVQIWPRRKHIPFKSFETWHLQSFEGAGHPVEITSLHDIRRLEKKHEARGLRFEAFSFDGGHFEHLQVPDRRPAKNPRVKGGFR